MDFEVDLEMFLRTQRKPYVCGTCTLGKPINAEIDKWLALSAAGEIKVSVTTLLKFLITHRDYPYKKDTLLRHLNECRAAEYEKAKYGRR